MLLRKCRNITIITYLQKNNQKEEKSPPTKLKTSHTHLNCERIAVGGHKSSDRDAFLC